MIYEIRENSILIFDHDSTNHSLPKEGWFHNCIFCSSITSLETEYKYYKLKNIKILACKDCLKLNKLEKNKDKINKWILLNILYNNEHR